MRISDWSSDVCSSDLIDVNRAVEAAARAFPIWARSPAVQRQMVLRAIAQRIRERLFDYAMLETLNNGKPITDAVTPDIPGAIGMFEYFAGTTFHSYGQIHAFPESPALFHRQPIGPVPPLTPWNRPL